MGISTQHIRLRFLGVFFFALMVQTFLWFSSLPYTDSDLWTRGAEHFARGEIFDFSTPIPAHPGTTILIPAALLILVGIPSFVALQITMTLLMSCTITAIAYQCFLIRPKSLWWVGTTVFLIPYALYLQMTPPSALAGVLSALFTLLILRTREQSATSERFFWIGVCGGLLLATRIDTGLAMIVLCFPYLWFLARERIIIALSTSALFFVALDPYLWAEPLAQLHTFAGQVGSNVYTSVGFGMEPWVLIFTMISFSFAFASVYFRPALTSVPRDFLLLLLVVSVVICGVILSSRYHPIRYFFPLMTIWEMFLPLFIFDCLDRYSQKNLWPRFLQPR